MRSCTGKGSWDLNHKTTGILKEDRTTESDLVPHLHVLLPSWRKETEKVLPEGAILPRDVLLPGIRVSSEEATVQPGSK